MTPAAAPSPVRVVAGGAAAPLRGLVFAGGGSRCLWQAGFMAVARPALALRPAEVGATSAGAAMACMVFGGVVEAGLADFLRRVRANPRNAYPWRALGRRPVFPHEGIYRACLLSVLDDAALARLHAGPDVRVLLARVPRPLGPVSGVLVGFLAYAADKRWSGGVHPQLGRRLGFAAEVVSVRDCRTPGEVADLVLQSSCTPPFTPIYGRGGRPALDGGLVDNVPLAAIDPGLRPALVLLTRRYPPEAIPATPGVVYVQPSRPIPVTKWDYTDADGALAAFDLGRRDAERFLRSPPAPEAVER